MTIHWDHAISQLDFLIALNFLYPINNMKLYKSIYNAWNKVVIVPLQWARNTHTMVDSFMCIHLRSSKIYTKAHRLTTNYLWIVWIHTRANNPSRSPGHTHPARAPHRTAQPIDNLKLNTTQQLLLYEHIRCTLYATLNMCRGTIIGRALFYSVC